MADPQNHLRQWRHNRDLLSRLPASHHDWMVTVALYTALHAVDALLAHDRVTGVVNHESRNDVLRRTKRYEQINRHYRPLYSLGRTVRYLADPSSWVAPEDVEPQVIRRYLYPIERSVQKLMGVDLRLEEITLRTGDTA